jgi:hypothetical protein
MDAKGDRILGINWRIIIGQGGVVTVRIPSIELDFEEVKVHGYEDGGLWIESRTLTGKVRRVIRQSSLPATPCSSCPTPQSILHLWHWRDCRCLPRSVRRRCGHLIRRIRAGRNATKRPHDFRKCWCAVPARLFAFRPRESQGLALWDIHVQVRE